MNNTPSAAADRWLICEIALQHYAMRVKHVVELVPLRDVTIYLPPQPPRHVEGMVDLRGEPIAVVDVRSVLGLQPMREETEGVIVVLEVAGGRFGAMVDNASEVRQIPADTYQSADFGDGTNDLVRHIVQDEEHNMLIQLLNVETMYAQCMAEHAVELVATE